MLACITVENSCVRSAVKSYQNEENVVRKAFQNVTYTRIIEGPDLYTIDNHK